MNKIQKINSKRKKKKVEDLRSVQVQSVVTKSKGSI